MSKLGTGSVETPWCHRGCPGRTRELLRIPKGPPPNHLAISWLWCGFGVALVWPWCGLGVALVWLWCGFGVALVWLCTPEYMPSICLLYGFAVALGGFRWPPTSKTRVFPTRSNPGRRQQWKRWQRPVPKFSFCRPKTFECRTSQTAAMTVSLALWVRTKGGNGRKRERRMQKPERGSRDCGANRGAEVSSQRTAGGSAVAKVR